MDRPDRPAAHRWPRPVLRADGSHRGPAAPHPHGRRPAAASPLSSATMDDRRALAGAVRKDTELGRLARRFTFVMRSVQFITRDFTEEEWRQPAGPAGGNTAHWLLGHLVTERRYILRELGEQVPHADWEDGFDIGATPGPPADYPSPEELFVAYGESDERLSARLHGLTPEECARDWGEKAMPDGERSVLGALCFMQFHESYHMGQLGLLRRIVGKSGLY